MEFTMITTLNMFPTNLPDGNWVVCVIDPVAHRKYYNKAQIFKSKSLLYIDTPKMVFVTNIPNSKFKDVEPTSGKYPTNIVELTVDGTRYLIVGLDFRSLKGANIDGKNKNKLLMQQHILDVVRTEIEPKNIFLCGITDGAEFEGIVGSGSGVTHLTELGEKYTAGFFIKHKNVPQTYTCTNLTRPENLFIFAQADICGTIELDANLVRMSINTGKGDKPPIVVPKFITQLSKYLPQTDSLAEPTTDLLNTWNAVVLKTHDIEDSSTVSLSKPEDQAPADARQDSRQESAQDDRQEARKTSSSANQTGAQKVVELNRYYAALRSINEKIKEIYQLRKEGLDPIKMSQFYPDKLQFLKKLYQEIATQVTDTYKSIDRSLIEGPKGTAIGGTRRTHVLRRHKTRKGKRFTKK